MLRQWKQKRTILILEARLYIGREFNMRIIGRLIGFIVMQVALAIGTVFTLLASVAVFGLFLVLGGLALGGMVFSGVFLYDWQVNGNAQAGVFFWQAVGLLIGAVIGVNLLAAMVGGAGRALFSKPKAATVTEEAPYHPYEPNRVARREAYKRRPMMVRR